MDTVNITVITKKVLLSKKQPINQEEFDLIHNALILLKRFEGVPQFEWLDDLEKRLYTTNKLGETLDSVVSFSIIRISKVWTRIINQFLTLL